VSNKQLATVRRSECECVFVLSNCTQAVLKGNYRENNKNNSNHDDIYSAVIMAEPLREFTPFTR